MEKRPKFYARLLAEGRGPLANEPAVPFDGEEAWEAFWALTSSRSVGMGGVGAIPFMAIDRYADRFGVTDFETFHRLLTGLDGAYLEYINSEGASGD